jgi:hypothetical protein
MASPHPLSLLLRPWRWLWPEEKALLLVAAAVFLVCSSTGTGFTVQKVVEGYQPMFGGNLMVILVGARIVQMWRKYRPSSKAWYNGLDLDADVSLLRLTVFLFSYITLYTNIKSRIPILNAAVHDEELHNFERWMLGGFDVVEQARSLSSSPALMQFLDRIYHHDYIFMTLMALFLHVQAGTRHLRHLFLGMAVLYLMGVTITAFWPTLGPCFVERDAYLWMREQGLQAWGSQEMLLKYYNLSVEAATDDRAMSAKAFTGIAAMPSLHVGHCMLLCRYAYHYEKRALFLLAPITLLTWLSTLVFGWHYLTDGLVSIPLVFLSWYISKTLIFGNEPVGIRDPAPS